MIYCVLCGSHVPGHDMVQAWGRLPVCQKHYDPTSRSAVDRAFKHWVASCMICDPPSGLLDPENKPAPDNFGDWLLTGEPEIFAAAMADAKRYAEEPYDPLKNKPAPDIDIRG